MNSNDYLGDPIEHIDIKTHDLASLIEAMSKMSFQARNLANAASIYQQMLADRSCCIMLTLAGSLFSAGLKQVVIDMINFNMVDVIISTGANIVDQDFFEAIGFRHYKGNSYLDDEELRAAQLDRIYDTLIREDELRICDKAIQEIADSLGSGIYSSRQFIAAMGEWLTTRSNRVESVVETAYKKNVPIFVPAFSDCSAGFGLVSHQHKRPDSHVAIDSVKDFRELTRLKINCRRTGLLMIGGGAPKNFAQDTVVAAELIGEETEMHRYSIQITVADERDGALSGSTLKEAHSWGKVNKASEQMVYCEATIAMPLLVNSAYHSKCWQERLAKQLATTF
jgi:deoxyhypusine synthase